MRPETRVIMITAYGTVEMAVEAIKLGACVHRQGETVIGKCAVQPPDQVVAARETRERRRWIGAVHAGVAGLDPGAVGHEQFHLHLPVQSGSNNILKKMNRGYTRELYLERILDLKNEVR